MIISKSWLQKYITLPDAEIDLESTLTNVGLEVEGIEVTGGCFTNVVVGLVETCEKHPNADKLHVCTVNDGGSTVTVVCGAPNVAAGQKIAFARVGAELPKIGIKVDKRKLRGVESSGMICSGAELGISTDHSGIMVLPADLEPGADLHDVLGKGDVLVQIGITPNRGDALCHIGVARDLSAVLDVDMHRPEIVDFAGLPSDAVKITDVDPDLCPRYSAALFQNVKIGPSPEWLRVSLESVGIRSINNVVDVTNFVMMETGQPLHAFDLGLLDGPEIIVRRAAEGENVTTLDGIERTLKNNALLICDRSRPVAIAGVMGAGNSEIRPETTSVLLESAKFDPSSVRKTSKLLGLSSESSYRFERSTDINNTVWVLQRAAFLLHETAGAQVTGYSDVYPDPALPTTIKLRSGRVRDIMGIEIPVERQLKILSRLGYECKEVDGGIECTVPTWCSDVEREIDVIEEVARINGYEHIPLERTGYSSDVFTDDMQYLSELRSTALMLGCDEIISSSLIPLDAAGRALPDGMSLAMVRNPVSKERPAMRPSLIPGMLETVDLNLRNGLESISIFEIGATYIRDGGKGGPETPVFIERMHICFALCGNAQRREWYAPERAYDFYDMKGLTQSFLGKLRIDRQVTLRTASGTQGSRTALGIWNGDSLIGMVEELGSFWLKPYGIDKPVFIAWMDIESLELAGREKEYYKAVPKYPKVDRDIAVVLDLDVHAEDLIFALKTASIPYLIDCRMVDVFTGSQIGASRKSIAVSLVFQSDQHTLTENEISSSVQMAVDILQAGFKAVLRS
jgi:phenylalanyl-tRNA synthetase beta chain